MAFSEILSVDDPETSRATWYSSRETYDLPVTGLIFSIYGTWHAKAACKSRWEYENQYCGTKSFLVC